MSDRVNDPDWRDPTWLDFDEHEGAAQAVVADDELAEHEREVLADRERLQAFVVADMLDQFRSYAQNMPLPGAMRQVSGDAYLPLGDDPSPTYLRRLFTERDYEQALIDKDSDDTTVRWAAIQWLRHRTEALTKYCYDTACLEKLPPQSKRRGRPRLYCIGCEEGGKKRHQRNKADPDRDERLPDLTRPCNVRSGHVGKPRNGIADTSVGPASKYDSPDAKKLLKQQKAENGKGTAPRADEFGAELRPIIDEDANLRRINARLAERFSRQSLRSQLGRTEPPIEAED